MSRLSDDIKNLKVDKRLYSLNGKMGQVDPEQHKSYLQGLEDLSAKSRKLNVFERQTNGGADNDAFSTPENDTNNQ